jgi:hypothetical protein
MYSQSEVILPFFLVERGRSDCLLQHSDILGKVGSAEKNVWSFISTPHTSSWHGA